MIALSRGANWQNYFWALTLGLFMAAAASPAGAEDGTPTITLVQGTVEYSHGFPPTWMRAKGGEQVGPGYAIRTAHDSRAEISLGTGTVRVYENSLLRLPHGSKGANGVKEVEQKEGSSIFEIFKRTPPQEFKVKTPEAVVMVKGTRFSVALGAGAVSVSVWEGQVGLKAESLANEIMVTPGMNVTGGTELPFELSLETQPDPWDGFTQGGSGPSPVSQDQAQQQRNTQSQQQVSQMQTAVQQAQSSPSTPSSSPSGSTPAAVDPGLEVASLGTDNDSLDLGRNLISDAIATPGSTAGGGVGLTWSQFDDGGAKMAIRFTAGNGTSQVVSGNQVNFSLTGDLGDVNGPAKTFLIDQGFADPTGLVKAINGGS